MSGKGFGDRRLRVGIYTFRIKDRPTGLANYTIALTRAMRSLDPAPEITLLTPYSTSELAWYGEFPNYKLLGSGLSSQWLGLGLAPVALQRAAKRLDLNVIHAPANVAPFLGPSKGIARVATVHDLAPLTAPNEHRFVARLGYRAAIPPLRWTADAVLTVSSSVADELATFGHIAPNRVFITSCGVDLPTESDLGLWREQGAAELGLKRGASYLLFVGDIRPRKNLNGILDAFSLTAPSHSDVKLVVVGQGMHRSSEIERKARHLGGAVVMTGYVDDDLLHRLYANAVGVLMPSYAEGFGLPALEAMAHGTPPVVSNLPVLMDLVGGAGIVVDPRSATDISKAIERLLLDEVARRSMGSAGRVRAARYTWRETAERTVEVYRRVLADRARSQTEAPVLPR